MQLLSTLSFVAVAVASVGQVSANHTLHFKNNCKQEITPEWKNGNSLVTKGQKMAPGSTWSADVPEDWVDARAYGQDGKCKEPDGADCTLLECTLKSGGQFNQCNLSRVSGFNVGMSFDWQGGSNCQPGKKCTSATCPPTDAWCPPDSCNGCLSQCNTQGVGLQVTFCP